ncbi:MAG: Na(+)-translocating NADH-quinone reductase subunit A [Bacteroidetes bacterium]|nr:Na(+)-translocating NADH-quinone reductase subunit A [Bacteroidota bacterium]
MSKVFKIKKGKDIRLEGEASRKLIGEQFGDLVAVKPTDFTGIKPKLEVQAGATVKAGDPLFHDKTRPDIKFTSPVSGTVTEIVRGDRRAIMAILVKADHETQYKDFQNAGNDADSIRKTLLSSGLWPCIIQRPFGVIADPDDSPKSIHISTFDSSPLAADTAFLLEGDEASFKKGIEILGKLAPKVYLNHSPKTNGVAAFSGLSGVEHNVFEGPHPSGLVGVQIHHLDPINKGETVWTLNVQSVIFIGRLFLTGNVDMRKKVALAGTEVSDSGYINTISGNNISALINGRTSNGNNRVISGNVLTGDKVGSDGYLGFYDNLLTIIPEGDQYEFMGWLFPTYARPTNSNSFPIFKYLKKSFKVNTNLHGEKRAFVVTGQYEKVLPMDILPVQLLKAILAQDLERMENLGIYEVLEEDLALCEFVCTSKIEVQQILRKGLTLMEEEG